MGKLRDLLDREVDRHDREWRETMQRLTVTERTEKRPVSIRSRGVERDCRVDRQSAGDLDAERSIVENFVH